MFFPDTHNKKKEFSFRKHHTKSSVRAGEEYLCFSSWSGTLEGSVTVEACLVFPIFFLAVIALLFLMPLMKNQEEIQVSVLETGKWASSMEYFYSRMDINQNLTEKLILQEKVKGGLSEAGFWENCVAGGRAGLAGLDSVMEEDIYVAVHHAIDLPVYVSNIYLRIGTQKARTRGFIGDTEFPVSHRYDNENIFDEYGKMVFVTDFGQVYHVSEKCSHLNLSIASTSLNQIDEKRNLYGACYYACERCDVLGDQVYYTEDGTRYHGAANCSSLKRTIYKVSQAQVKGLRCCSTCGG